MAKQDNFYDEDLDQPIADPRNPDNEKDDENEYQTFLAPKAAFAGKDLDVGAVHRVKIERVLSDELELRCIQKGGDDSEEDHDEELYD